ncbi:TolC family protein [Olivibacter sitiensis]|uniref:TolC family protein n=1 Tax=Olivibacter sitiensis TaxID=376470 RepID=UPI000428693C|nr:TolC family protein [Olivibacter sitiensis]
MIRFIGFVLLYFLTIPSVAKAQQDSTTRLLKIEELFTLAEEYSKELAIAKQDIAISEQQTDIAKSARLPEFGANLSMGVISNAVVWDNHWKNWETARLPHISQSFIVDASQIIYQGNKINNTIKKAQLAEQLAGLNYEQNREDIRFLLLGRYFDLYRMFNEKRIYEQNIALAKQRMENIQKLKQEGMVTQNDIIRTELQLTNFEVALDQVSNDITIANRELCVVLGLPTHTAIQVDTALSAFTQQDLGFVQHLNEALSSNPVIRASQVREDMAQQDIKIAKGDKSPILSLYAEDMTARPFLYDIPPLDMYMNYFQGGIRLHYNISSLYHAKEHIKLAKMEYTKQQKETELLQEKTELQVHQAYVKWQESKRNYASLEKSYQLANSNYQIVENKYYNQFAVLTDMLDASTAKLDAELQMNNARASILFRWYQLQKAIGKL